MTSGERRASMGLSRGAGRVDHAPAGEAGAFREPLVDVNVQFPRSMAVAIDVGEKEWSDFIRKAVTAAL